MMRSILALSCLTLSLCTTANANTLSMGWAADPIDRFTPMTDDSGEITVASHKGYAFSGFISAQNVAVIVVHQPNVSHSTECNRTYISTFTDLDTIERRHFYSNTPAFNAERNHCTSFIKIALDDGEGLNFFPGRKYEMHLYHVSGLNLGVAVGAAVRSEDAINQEQDLSGDDDADQLWFVEEHPQWDTLYIKSSPTFRGNLPSQCSVLIQHNGNGVEWFVGQKTTKGGTNYCAFNIYDYHYDQNGNLTAKPDSSYFDNTQIDLTKAH